jgi:hypothetical protein
MKFELIPGYRCPWWWRIMFTYCWYLHSFASGSHPGTNFKSKLSWSCWIHSLGVPLPRTHGSSTFCPAGRASSMPHLTRHWNWRYKLKLQACTSCFVIQIVKHCIATYPLWTKYKIEQAPQLLGVLAHLLNLNLFIYNIKSLSYLPWFRDIFQIFTVSTLCVWPFFAFGDIDFGPTCIPSSSIFLYYKGIY